MGILTGKDIQAWFEVSYGNGCGNGLGNGYGNGNGYGLGNGYGYGNGLGYGLGNGYGYGNGNGLGLGNGNGNGNGLGNGNGDGISEIDGVRIYPIDDIPTAISAIHGNVAKGFILKHNVCKQPCFVVKGNGKFAHGETLHDAFAALQEKSYDGSTEEERLNAFIAKFPEYDVPYSNDDLFVYHHILTGSCRIGREQFCQNRDISLDGETTVRQFVELTKDSYGGEMIDKLPQLYSEQ